MPRSAAALWQTWAVVDELAFMRGPAAALVSTVSQLLTRRLWWFADSGPVTAVP